MTKRRPVWLQVPVVLVVTYVAAIVGAGLSDTVRLYPASGLAMWAGALAAPLAVVGAVLLRRSGRISAWPVIALSVAIYLAAALLAGAFRRRPMMLPTLGPLLFPTAGVVWGGLLHALARRGLLPFAERREQAPAAGQPLRG